MAKNIPLAKDRLIDINEALLLSDINAVQQLIFDRVLEVLKGLDVSDGSLVVTQQIERALDGVEQNILGAMADSGYKESVENYIANFDQIDKLTFDQHNSLNNIRPTLEQINPVRKAVIDETVNVLAGNKMNNAFIQPVKDVLSRSVVFGETVEDAERNLRRFILTDEKLGGLERHVTQIARDATSQYNGAINNKIAQDFNLNAFRYVGSLITDSRCQCVHWVGKGVLPKDDTLAKEIEAAVLGAPISSCGASTGMIPQTNIDNFVIYRGGFNCRHEAIPTRI